MMAPPAGERIMACPPLDPGCPRPGPKRKDRLLVTSPSIGKATRKRAGGCVGVQRISNAASASSREETRKVRKDEVVPFFCLLSQIHRGGVFRLLAIGFPWRRCRQRRHTAKECCARHGINFLGAARRRVRQTGIFRLVHIQHNEQMLSVTFSDVINRTVKRKQLGIIVIIFFYHFYER